MAYEAVGLLWAARANVLNALNQAFVEFWEHGEILPQALTCLRKLVWLELQLGRIPPVIRWMELASFVAHHLSLNQKKEKSYFEERFAQDAVLGILLLKADISALRLLESLPAILDELKLDLSWMALLYALGYEDRLRAEGIIPEAEGEQKVVEFFEKWIKQPAAKDLPAKPELLVEDTITLWSSVLGSQITARVSNDFDSISLGEQILASLEALLATSIEGVFPHAEEFTIRVKRVSGAKPQPEHAFDEGETGQILSVVHGGGWTANSSVKSSHSEWLRNVVLEIAARIVFIDDIHRYADRVFGREVALGRAINFSDMGTPLRNILGASSQAPISDWQPRTQSADILPLRRARPWYYGLNLIDTETSGAAMRNSMGEAEPPKGVASAAPAESQPRSTPTRQWLTQ